MRTNSITVKKLFKSSNDRKFKISFKKFSQERLISNHTIVVKSVKLRQQNTYKINC